MNKGKVIAVVNQKGGVGKTTTTFNLGACLAEQGKKVLLVDLDQQGSLTYCMGHEVPDDVNVTIAQMMNSEISDTEYDTQLYVEDWVLTEGVGNQYKEIKMDYICCNVLMSTVEMNLVNAYCRESILKSIIAKFNTDYDYILLDCGPSLGMITVNALVAADSVLIPLQAEKFAALGLELLLKNIIRVKKHLNPGLEIEGILFVAVQEQYKESQTTVKEVIEKFGTAIKVFPYAIKRKTEVAKAIRRQLPMVMYEDKVNGIKLGSSVVAEQYRTLAKEVMLNE